VPQKWLTIQEHRNARTTDNGGLGGCNAARLLAQYEQVGEQIVAVLLAKLARGRRRRRRRSVCQ
jgi:hypothetical protein